MKSLASKRLKASKGPRPYSEDEMDFLIFEQYNDRDRARRERARTRTVSEVTLNISYPNGVRVPWGWNWQYMVSKAFPDAEVEVKCWTKPHPDWS